MICPYCQNGKIAVTLMDHSGSYSMCRRCAIHWGLKLQDVTTLDDPAPTQTKPLTPTEETVLLERWAKVKWPVNR